MSEQDLFNRFKERPCRDALVGVLRASQDRIYGLCFRILRRHEDAEDASQKVLLRLLDLVGELKDGEHYTRMVSRLALFVALDEARARSTRRAHERRKCEMRSDGSVPELPEDVTPLYSHLGRLDERSRDLIVDH